jgi:hypothetical protein
MSINIHSMNKQQLRAACKVQGIKYGSLDNKSMRAALLSALPPVSTDAPPSPPAKVEVVADTSELPPAKKARAKRTSAKPATRTAQPSIRAFLAEQFAKGEFTTQAALAYAASTGRSRTTVNVQANKLGYSMKGAAFEPRAVK